MAGPVPFRRAKKGVPDGPWITIIPGKGVIELGDPETTTKEQASAKLAEFLTSLPTPEPKRNQSLPQTSQNMELSKVLTSTSEGASTDSKTADKPKTGDFMYGSGLAAMPKAKLEAFQKVIAQSLASGNVSVDRLLVSLFRDDVPLLAPNEYLLLQTGWELACQQYFKDGVPPAWIIILLGNVMLVGTLAERSQPKKVEQEVPIDEATKRASGIIPGLPRPN
jgi:hypothetical protein